MITDANKNTQLSNNNFDTFKSNLENKTLIYFYQISCKDPNVTDNYIGQAECFETRESQHRRESENSNIQILKFIK
jgi:hypothetical protein